MPKIEWDEAAGKVAVDGKLIQDSAKFVNDDGSVEFHVHFFPYEAFATSDDLVARLQATYGKFWTDQEGPHVEEPPPPFAEVDPATLRVRRNIYELSQNHLDLFFNGLLAMKKSGVYDKFIRGHHMAMMNYTLAANETSPFDVPAYERNSAHRGPAFGPWHRVGLREFELALVKAAGAEGDLEFGLPYWDWAADAALGVKAPIFDKDHPVGKMLGGGSTTQNGLLQGGLFTEWKAVVHGFGHAFVTRDFPGIYREAGTYLPKLPGAGQIDAALAIPNYDTAPFNIKSKNSFRNRLEGWDKAWATQGLHNAVHGWMGGDMIPGTSPNDPLFFLHHCFVDLLWARWQALHPDTYTPVSGGPKGHNRPDAMENLMGAVANPTPDLSMDYSTNLGYTYNRLEVKDSKVRFFPFADPWLNKLVFPGAAVVDMGTVQEVSLSVWKSDEPGSPFQVVKNPKLVPPTGGSTKKEAFLFRYVPPETGVAPLTATTVLRVDDQPLSELQLTVEPVLAAPVAAALVLDLSGSMAEAAGAAGVPKIDLLRNAAGAFAGLMHGPIHALGIVTYNDEANSAVPLGVADPLVPDPTAGFFANLSQEDAGGMTAIGKGVLKAKEMLLGADLPAIPGAADWRRTILVFTDGKENVYPLVGEVMKEVADAGIRCFAVGLGGPDEVSSKALGALAAQTGGGLWLTGSLLSQTGTVDVDSEDYFLLGKLFLQILADLEQLSVAEDPAGTILPGETIDVPFRIVGSDVMANVILLTDVPGVSLELVTPAGEVVPGSLDGVLPGQGLGYRNVRFALPLDTGKEAAHGGTWRARLRLDEGAAGSLRRESRGVRYSLSVHTRSLAVMSAAASQQGRRPGDPVFVRLNLAEYGVPLAGAHAEVDVVRPDGSKVRLPLSESGGRYTGVVPTDEAGVYRLTVRAHGVALDGHPFVRERLLTAAVSASPDSEPDMPSRIERSLEILSRWLPWMLGLGLVLLVLLLIVLILLLWQ